jgi:ribosomal protein S18 acetylase RimI-like enzyme
VEVRRVTPDLDTLLLAFLGDEGDGRGFCFCTAWWVPTWEEWKTRTAEENRALRMDLLARGERDGYLLLDGGLVVGWCQVGPRDRLPKLVKQYGLAPDPAAWAITCFEISPSRRGRGAAALLLGGVLEDLRARGAARVQGFPRCGAGLDPGEAWTGPEGLFRSAGFVEVARGARGPVVERRLDPPGESINK